MLVTLSLLLCSPLVVLSLLAEGEDFALRQPSLLSEDVLVEFPDGVPLDGVVLDGLGVLLV